MSNVAERARHPAVALLLLSLLVGFALALASCGGTRSGAEAPNRPDPFWGELLESHTTGVISRGSDIRVIFATNVVTADRVGKPAGATFKMSPKHRAR